MLKQFPALCLAVLVLPFCASSIIAQSGDLTPPDSKWGEAIKAAAATAPTPPRRENAYDARALRLESDWGRLRILQGADGLVVGTAGILKTVNAEKIVAGSPRAETEAKIFRASHRRGALSGAVGAVTLVVGIVASSSNSNNAATPVLMIAGAGAMIWGAGQINSAYSSLSRAIWWYNRDLAR